MTQKPFCIATGAQVARGEACQAEPGGKCSWVCCPQRRDREPGATGRECPLYQVDQQDASQEPASRWFAIAFEGLANACAMAYGSPVYLCGSALREARPGDFDIRVVMSENDLQRMFGDDTELRRGTMWTERKWRIAREQLKQSRRFSHGLGVNIDFQIQSISDATRREKNPRLRLDRATDYDLRAGEGPA